MQVLRRIDDIRRFVLQEKNAGRRVGFVPTMGYLHAGHLSLIERVRQHADTVVASIFVNPTQFGAGEDLDNYPRDESGDLNKARMAGCDVVFIPSVRDMYSADSETVVSPGVMAEQLCGSRRPGHFSGVCTVVLKLFNIIGCDVACFGEKDFQQLAIIRRMVTDLNVPVDILSAPIVREDDGLAMSSRNVYLNDQERSQAPVLRRALLAAESLWMAGERDSLVLNRAVRQLIDSETLAQTDYVEVCCATSLQPWENLCQGPTVIAIAVHFGVTRLIDNIQLQPQPVTR